MGHGHGEIGGDDRLAFLCEGTGNHEHLVVLEALSESQDYPVEEEVAPLDPEQLEKLSEMATRLT